MNNYLQHIGPNLKSWFAVALVSVPMAISLAIVCWWTPIMWLLSGVWAWVMAAIFCSSPHNAYWPAWALAGILLPIALEHWVQFFPLMAILAWLIMLIVWALRLSNYLNIIPWAVLQWFLLGIALIIGIQQIPAILWVSLDYSALEALWRLTETNRITVVLFAVSLFVLQFCRRKFPQMPGIIVVAILWVLVGRYDSFSGALWIDKLIDIYGEIWFSLFQWQNLSSYVSLLDNAVLLQTLITASVWVAVIALLETLISAKIATKQTRKQFSSQREVYWLGLTNIVTWLVWWMPVSALVPRTTLNIDMWATNKRSGALIGIFTAVFAAFLFSNALQFLPFAVIAWVLVDIALGMFNVSLYNKLRNTEKSSIIIIAIVWVISYLRDPMLGILIGTTTALMIVVMRAMKGDLVANVFRDGHHINKTKLVTYTRKQHEDDMILIKLEWELNYLNADNHTLLLRKLQKPHTIILWFWYTCVIDNDAAEEIDIVIQEYIQQWKKVFITGLEGQNLSLFSHGDGYQMLEKEGNTYASKTKLLETILA